MRTRIGIFGGSFDPIHRGHVLLAETALATAHLERLLLVPAAAQPLKPQGPVASAPHRLAMARLAVEASPAMDVSSTEIDRGGVSYTIDTLQTLRAENPNGELHLVLGADALADLPNWRNPDGICELAILLVVHREGTETAAAKRAVESLPAARNRITWMPMPPCDVSSTEIRSKIAAGKPIHTLVPPGVADYIREHGLYR